MKQVLKNSLLYVMMLLYCSAVLPVHASESEQITTSDYGETVDQFDASKLLSAQVISIKIDFQLKAFNEKEENQKRKLSKLVFSRCTGVVIARDFCQLFRSKVDPELYFSQTDIIFPFHNFW